MNSCCCNNVSTETETLVETRNGIDFFQVRYNREYTFRNVQETAFYSKKKGFKSWIDQYKKHIDGSPQNCMACGKEKKLLGGHMKRKDKLVDINNHFIIPICYSCNNYRNDKITEVFMPADTLLLKAKPSIKKRMQKVKYHIEKKYGNNEQ